MGVFEDEVLEVFLEKAVGAAKEEIRTKGVLSLENAVPLLLRSQFRRIIHLDGEVSAIEKEIRNIREEIADIRADIANMATKNDIADMVVKADIANMATKDDIKSLRYMISIVFGVLFFGMPLLLGLVMKFLR